MKEEEQGEGAKKYFPRTDDITWSPFIHRLRLTCNQESGLLEEER